MSRTQHLTLAHSTDLKLIVLGASHCRIRRPRPCTRTATMASTPSAPPPAFQTPPPRNRTQATTTSAANRATATTRISPPRPSSAAPLNARKTLNFADSASAAASVAPPARPPRHNRTKSLQPSMASLEELHPELARCSRCVLRPAFSFAAFRITVQVGKLTSHCFASAERF